MRLINLDHSYCSLTFNRANPSKQIPTTICIKINISSLAKNVWNNFPSELAVFQIWHQDMVFHHSYSLVTGVELWSRVRYNLQTHWLKT